VNRLDGKVAIVTGAARGQGEAEARLFVAQGAKVVLGDVLDDQGREVAASIGADTRFEHLDVTDEDNWQAVVTATVEAFGPPSILVNNAGILVFNPITKQDAAEYRRVLDVNLTGAFLGIKTVARSMIKGGGGSIINISSNAGMEGLPMLAAYSSSKWGLRGLSRTAALELGRSGIRVNTVHPGGVDTPMLSAVAEWISPRVGVPANELLEGMGPAQLGRRVAPMEVARVIAFLLTDEAKIIRGQSINIDGGETPY